ncbi:TRAP transporter large permease subunit, partial [Citrobacter sp. AAK_AS5]
WSYLMRSENIDILPRASRAERMAALKDGVWALFLPVIIIGGIRTGVFTPTEAAVVAAVYAIVISALVYRTLTIKLLFEVLVGA